VSKKFLIIIAVLSALAIGFYGYMGGFDSPDVAIATSEPVTIVGKYYAGPVENKQFGQLFQETGKALEEKKLAGTLANIYYNNPEDQNDSIKAFVGVAVKTAPMPLPSGYELRHWPGGQRVVRITSKAHFLLAPNKLYPALFDYLKNRKLKVRKQYLEMFPENGPAVIEAELI